MKKERNKRANILICIAALLLCAALLSIHLAGGLLAGFSKTENGSDSARVAVFDITGEGLFSETMEVAVTPDSSQTNGITIKNNSEVSIEYTLTVTKKTDNLPVLKFKLNDKDGNNISTSSGDSTEITTISYQLPASQTNEYNLAVSWTAQEEEKDLALMGKVDYITISVKAVQID